MYDTFKELGLVPEIMKAIEDMGYLFPRRWRGRI